MTRLYVDSFESNNVTKYGIFDVWGDKPQLYTEDFQPLVFDTEEEAKARLAAIEAEKERSDKAIPFSLEDAKKYAESHFWKFASTYAKSAPHEYLVKRWLVEEDQLLFERFVATMKENSVVGYFYGHKNMYLILGDHYYWHMPGPENLAVDLINRTTTDYLEYKDGAYYYRESSIRS